MVVRIFEKKHILIPLFFGVIFSVLYGKVPTLIFAGLLGGIAFTLLTIYNINIGIIAAVVSLPFLPDMLSMLFIIYLVIIFLFNQISREGYALRKSFVDIPIALFVIAIIIGTVTSINPTGSFRDLALHIASIGLIFVIVNSVNTKNELNVILTFFVFTATLVALYGVYQYFIGVELDPAWVDEANNPDLTTRVFSVFGNPNILAEYLIMSIPTSAALFWNSKKITKKLIFLVTTLILTGTLFLTMSRGGWLGLAFGIFIFILLIEKRLFLLLIPAGVASIFILPQSIINRIMTIGSLADSSNAYRVKIWQITMNIIRDHWLVGVGFGYIPFKQTFETYIRTMPIYHAHSTYLEFAAELGILGFLLFIGLIFVIVKYAIKTLKKSEDKYIKVIIAGLLAGIAGLLFHGLVEHVLYMPRIIFTFWTVIGFILTAMKVAKQEDKKDTQTIN